MLGICSMYRLSSVRYRSTNIALLVDKVQSLPLLYPMLYSMSKCSFLSFNSQLSNIHAIKQFYEFWQSKFGCSFCYSFYKAKTNPQIAVEELDEFYQYISRSRKITESENSHRNYETVSKILNTLINFLHFLNDEFVNSRYEYSNDIELTSIHNYISNRLKAIKKDFSTSQSKSKNIFGSSVQPAFDSLTKNMIEDLFSLIKPSTKNEENLANPYGNKKVQFRNFLIFRLLINYGLRISELLLLEISSVKTTLRGRHALVVTNALDNEDSRKKLSIKNSNSHRVLEITENDYRLIQTYIDIVREKSSDNSFLFISSKKPFKAIDYQSVRFACSILNDCFFKKFPQYFDIRNVDSIKNIHIHTFRHTWATMTLSALYKAKRAELIRNCKLSGIAYSEKGLLEEAKDELRKLGGWSVHSQIPNLYAARFIQEKANESNLERLNSFYNPILMDN